MPKISLCLWFEDRAEEAAEFYVSLFDDGRITNVSRYPESSPGVPGAVMTVQFELGGLDIQGLNGGPMFTLSEAVSLVVNPVDQLEIDRLWDALISDGGAASQCGWLRDRFGLSWQIVPPVLGELLSDPDPEKQGRVMRAMLKMTKIDIAQLRAAHAGP